jgi:hypothetical protein
MNIIKYLPIAALSVVSISAATAAPSITGYNLGNLTEMPGSSTDYSFLGVDNQFSPDDFGYGGGSPDIGVQTHFTMTPLVGESYGGDGRYTVINNPLGASTQTGILFGRSGVAPTSQGILQLNLGHTKFNYADFNLFVMYGNDLGDTYARNSAITVTDVTKSLSLTFDVTETNTSFSEASFAEFHIFGASAGDVLQIGAQSPGGFNYIGGVSLLAEVPEPSTYALTLSAVGLIVLVNIRRSRKNLV